MIVDFTISNFRSIKTEQTFSLYAENPGSYLRGNISYPGNGKIGVLKSAGIYGANASGKSNLLLAISALEYIIVSTEKLKDGDKIICYEPYMLSEDTKTAPTHFEIEFYTPDKVRYKYAVSFTKTKIVEESLDYYSSTKSANLFSRKPEDNWETINFGTLYKGGKRKHAFFENNSYLSVAGSKADTPELVRKVYNYFRKEIFYLKDGLDLPFFDYGNDSKTLDRISKFLSFADTGIVGIKQEENKEIKDFKFPKDMPEEVREYFIERNRIKYLFSHKTETGSLEHFELTEESSGTQKIFKLAPLLITILETGGILVFDELENSMHPFMAELIIKLFNDEEVNVNGAQLIFSTHNHSLMSSDYMRRDQIWLVEKNNGATVFYSLDDFDSKKIKPQSPFNKWYAEGRFGAFPKINYREIARLFKPFGADDAKA